MNKLFHVFTTFAALFSLVIPGALAQPESPHATPAAGTPNLQVKLSDLQKVCCDGNSSVYAITNLGSSPAFMVHDFCDSDLNPLYSLTTSTPAGGQILIRLGDLSSLPDGVYTVVVSSNQPIRLDNIIAGRITDTKHNPIPKVAVAADLAGGGAPLSTSTDASGYYTITVAIAGTYLITPTLTGYTFGPKKNRTTVVPTDTTSKDFTGYDKPPIVFVSGLNPAFSQVYGPAYFDRIDDDLHAAGYYVGFANSVSSALYTPSFQGNVPVLVSALDQAKDDTGAAQVILIAHSMGGLITRAYLESDLGDQRNDVLKFFDFGSPHLGTNIDWYIALLPPAAGVTFCAVQAGVCEMTQASMGWFNRTHSPRLGRVPYYLVGGDAPRDTLTVLGKIGSWAIGGHSDGIVPTQSALGLAGGADRMQTNEAHSATLGPNRYFQNRDAVSYSYAACLDAVLLHGAGHCAGSSPSLQVTAGQTADTGRRTPFQSGHLQVGQTITHTVATDGGKTDFMAQWLTGQVTFTLISPTGVKVDPPYAAGHPAEVTYTADDTGAVYTFPTPNPGVWKMVFQAGNLPAGGTNYLTFAGIDSPHGLNIGSDQNWYKPGATATITTALSGSPLTSAVTATIIFTNGLTDTVDLAADAGGGYHGIYTIPDAPGLAELVVTANGTTASGAPFERGASQFFQIAPQSLSLTGAYHDTAEPNPSDPGLNTALNIDVGVESMYSGTVGISGDLIDAQGKLVAHAMAASGVVTGTATVRLRFDGRDLFAGKRSGPYKLTNLIVLDMRGAALAVVQVKDVFTTQPWDYRRFAPTRLHLPMLRR